MEIKGKELDYMLKIINAYEETDRVSIALNTIEKVKQFTKLTDTRKISEWIMQYSDYTQYKTVYTWISPNRTSKVPLKVIIRMAIKMDIPIEEFLKKNDHASRDDLRREKTKRSSSEVMVENFVNENPEATLKEIATALNLREGTIRRHLENLNILDKYMVRDVAKRKKINVLEDGVNVEGVIEHIRPNGDDKQNFVSLSHRKRGR